MCGIVAIAKRGRNNILYDLEYSMRVLSYRGYDSHGCLLVWDDEFRDCYRAIGEISDDFIEKMADEVRFSSMEHERFWFAVGHTRWATHGPVDLSHAHPVVSEYGGIILVHNGTYTKTVNGFDSLAIANELETLFDNVFLRQMNKDLVSNSVLIRELKSYIKNINGDNAVVFSNFRFPRCLFAFTTGNQKLFRCKNVIASEPLTKNDQWKPIDGLTILTVNEKRDSDYVEFSDKLIINTMFDEICEQPEIVRNFKLPEYTLPSKCIFDTSSDDYSDYTFVGCGSSYIAAMMGTTIISDYVNRPKVVHAAEFALTPHSPAKTIGITQSGETHDMRKINMQCLITNNPQSSILNKWIQLVNLNLSKEMAVAATKTFMATALTVAGMLKPNRLRGLDDLATLLERSILIRQTTNYKNLVNLLSDKPNALILGSYRDYPIAMEGALKLKEVAGIHAEAMSSSEMKHGPIALIDKNMPVIFLLTDIFHGELNSVLRSNTVAHIMEVKSRGGIPVQIGPQAITESDRTTSIVTPIIKNDNGFMQALSHVVILQMLSYDVAEKKGLNPNRPRNLAKCVTV